MRDTAALRLETRAPFDAEALLRFLGARAVPGVEHFDGRTYRRSLALEKAGAVVQFTPRGNGVDCLVRSTEEVDPGAAGALCRRLLDLDADPASVESSLGPDPLIGPLVRRRPGLRVPSTVDGFELAVRAIVGQQVSVAGARTVLGRLVADFGAPIEDGDGEVTRRFPTPGAFADCDPGAFPFPRVRGEALRSLARLVLDGRLALRPGADPAATRAALLAIRGVGPWTASYIGMRALLDRDAWLPGDVGLRQALVRLGESGEDKDALRQAKRWQPFRSYAVVHLWASL